MNQRPDGDAPRYFGLYPALVTDIEDPDSLGRVQVKFPWLGKGGDEVRAWATLLSPYAGDQQGFLAVPKKDTQVIVGFEAGDPRRPYVVGSAWNGSDKPPESFSAAKDKRVLKTASGSTLELDDSPGATKITLGLKSGHKLVLDDSAQEVKIAHASGVSITLNMAGKVVIQGNSGVDITAPLLNIHAATAVFDGMVTCANLTATAGVVSPLYAVGVGNLLGL